MYMGSDFDSDSDDDYLQPVIVRKPNHNTVKKYSNDNVSPWLMPENENATVELEAKDNKTDNQVAANESNVEADDDSEKQIISCFINEGDYPIGYDEITDSKKNKTRPRFFLDICNILCGARCETLIKLFNDSELTFQDLLNISDDKLKDLGILPFQRKLIIDSLYRMHKQPYHPNSLHVVPLDEAYSNQDVAIQLLTLVKQMTVMQGTLVYLRRNCNTHDLTSTDRIEIVNLLKEIRKRISLCKRVLDGLCIKSEEWDRMCQPADLITKHSKRRFRWTPNRIIVIVMCVSVSYKLWNLLR